MINLDFCYPSIGIGYAGSVEQFFPIPLRNFFKLFNSALSIVFMILVVYYGVKVTAVQTTAEYDALPFSRGVLFVVAPLVGSLMTLYLTGVLVRQIKQIFGNPPKA